jgi:energy-coupling factor transport system permease protein
VKLSGGVSIGQFIPGESLVHSLDPRSKILGLFILMAGPLMARSPSAFIPMAVLLAAVCRLSGIKIRAVLRSGRPIVFLVAFTVALNLFWTPGREIVRAGPLSITEEGVTLAAAMGLRLYFLVMFAAMMMMTTSPMAFAAGVESIMSPLARLRVPVSEIAMMMTIALRFIPTLFEETDRILKAQMSRGADFESGGMLKRARSYIPVLVPLFVLVFARAENLATAMESRCYVPGLPRTRLNPLVWGKNDTAAIICAAAFVFLSVLWGRHAGPMISRWLEYL